MDEVQAGPGRLGRRTARIEAPHDMPVIVYCKDCGKKIRAPDGPAGRRGKCPRCGVTVPIPESDEAGPPADQDLLPKWRTPAEGEASAKSAPSKTSPATAPSDGASLGEDAPTPPEPQEPITEPTAATPAKAGAQATKAKAATLPAKPGKRIQLPGAKTDTANTGAPATAQGTDKAPSKETAETPEAKQAALPAKPPAKASPAKPAGKARGQAKIKLGGMSAAPDKAAAAGGIKLDGKVEEVEQGITWDDSPDPPPAKGPMVLAFLIAAAVGLLGFGVWWLMQEKPPSRMTPEERKAKQFKVKPQEDEIDRLRTGEAGKPSEQERKPAPSERPADPSPPPDKKE